MRKHTDPEPQLRNQENTLPCDCVYVLGRLAKSGGLRLRSSSSQAPATCRAAASRKVTWHTKICHTCRTCGNLSKRRDAPLQLQLAAAVTCWPVTHLESRDNSMSVNSQACSCSSHRAGSAPDTLQDSRFRASAYVQRLPPQIKNVGHCLDHHINIRLPRDTNRTRCGLVVDVSWTAFVELFFYFLWTHYSPHVGYQRLRESTEDSCKSYSMF